jgi:dUTP pyrophosphatase
VGKQCHGKNIKRIIVNKLQILFVVTRIMEFITKKAVLFLYVSKDFPELRELYKTHVQNHNQSIENNLYANSGFDIFVPEDTKMTSGLKSQMVNFQIKAEMRIEDGTPAAYYLFPRSSISKTPLLLANQTGIIDSGYRGFIMGAFRCFDDKEYSIEKNTRLLQICHPSLCPIRVVLLENESDLSSSERGSGGFGSTGLVGIAR